VDSEGRRGVSNDSLHALHRAEVERRAEEEQCVRFVANHLDLDANDRRDVREREKEKEKKEAQDHRSNNDDLRENSKENEKSSNDRVKAFWSAWDSGTDHAKGKEKAVKAMMESQQLLRERLERMDSPSASEKRAREEEYKGDRHSERSNESNHHGERLSVTEQERKL
jgi:hypothetical protein